jgi:phage I-like protein
VGTVADNEGPATNRYNDPVIDPTENVKALSAAANERQDDLRNLESEHLREILQLRTDHVQEIRAADAALADCRFAAVQREQSLIEQHRIELKGDSEKALNYALASAKEAVREQNLSNTLAVDRAVAGMKELIVNNAQVTQATTNALGDKVEDLKSSVAIIVNQRLGAQELKTEQRGGSANVFGLVGAVVGVLSLIIAAVAVIIATR